MLATGAATAWLLVSEPQDILETNVNAEDLVYLCEGEGSILCAYKGKARGWRGCLLQLPKDSPAGATAAEIALLRAKVQRALVSHAFETRFIEQSQLVALPIATVRAIDAHVLSARPQEQRMVKLALQEHAEHHGQVLALRMGNLMEVPPSLGSDASPMVTVELPLGCGLKEVADLPSRHAMAWHLAQEGKPSGTPRCEPASFFTGSKDQLREALQASILPPSHCGSCRVFVDGQPVHPATLPGSEGWSAAKRTVSSGDALAGRLAGCSPSCTEELVAALAAVLAESQAGHGFLVDLQRLQCYAAGECEKLAPRLLEDLRAHGGPEAVAELGQPEHIAAAIAAASRGWSGKDGVRAHEREGKRLLATASRGPQETAALQRWLGLFLLGRAAMGARALLSFFSAGAGATASPAEQRRLRSLRCAPLGELLPGEAWCAELWARVTVAGVERPAGAGEVGGCGGELEELVKRYRESIAAAQ